MEIAFNKNLIFLALAVLAIIITGFLLFTKANVLNAIPMGNFFGMSSETVAKKAVDFLNANKEIYLNGQTVELLSSSHEEGLVKMKIQIGTDSFDSYATKNGTLLFPRVINLDQAPETN